MTGLVDLPARFCPVCSTTVGKAFNPGPAGRPDASCPNCGSLERHRFLALLLACVRPALGSIDVLLDVAPSPQVTPLLARLGPAKHIRFDLGADNRLVDVVGSLTEAPFDDDYVDLLVCYHVLEHIPDDRAAMREIARVLKPGGVAVLQVPWRPGTVTDEDPDAPEAERLLRFGQADHVRYYGDDFQDRLIDSGLTLSRVTPEALVGRSVCDWCRLVPDEAVWLATPSDAPNLHVVDPAGLTSLSRLFEGLADAVVAGHERAGRAERRLRKAGKRIAVLEQREGYLYRAGRRLPPSARASLRTVLRAARRRRS